jgi:hypothetical protein
MQTAFIICGTVGGGVFFQEFESVNDDNSSTNFGLYALGICTAMVGIALTVIGAPRDNAEVLETTTGIAPAAADVLPTSVTRGKGQTAASPLLVKS